MFCVHINFLDCSVSAIYNTTKRILDYWQEGSTSTAIPSTSNSNIVNQYNKIEGITSTAIHLAKNLKHPTGTCLTNQFQLQHHCLFWILEIS